LTKPRFSSGVEAWEKWGFFLFVLKERRKLKKLFNGKGGRDEKK
jgi:hypothetical protein